jgi:hypothetical protein
MQTFFHGWRRKTGVVTLAMACAFMGLDLRSRLVHDNLHHAVGESADSYTLNSLESYGGRIAWFRGTYEKRSGHSESLGIPKRRSNHPFIVRANGTLLKDDKIKWRWSCCGFGFATIPSEPNDFPGVTIAWSVAYLSAVISLTLLSAYLLLVPSSKRAVTQSHA